MDALTDPGACLRDAALLQKLGINTIHVYGIDPKLSHDECVSIFDSVGIYIFISLSWNNTGPAAVPNAAAAYNFDFMQSSFAVVDAFKDYENLLGFFVGDEIGEINPGSFAQESVYLRVSSSSSLFGVFALTDELGNHRLWFVIPRNTWQRMLPDKSRSALVFI